MTQMKMMMMAMANVNNNNFIALIVITKYYTWTTNITHDKNKNKNVRANENNETPFLISLFAQVIRLTRAIPSPKEMENLMKMKVVFVEFAGHHPNFRDNNKLFFFLFKIITNGKKLIACKIQPLTAACTHCTCTWNTINVGLKFVDNFNKHIKWVNNGFDALKTVKSGRV